MSNNKVVVDLQKETLTTLYKSLSFLPNVTFKESDLVDDKVGSYEFKKGSIFMFFKCKNYLDIELINGEIVAHTFFNKGDDRNNSIVAPYKDHEKVKEFISNSKVYEK